ncbi:MAG: PfkB family carbohydrate kinase [Candidatus Limnocylindrales bacterium]
MIVVIGAPLFVPGEPGRPSAAAGRAVAVARAAIQAGAGVELIGKVGRDPAGDAVLIALAADGIGHAAVLRDPARPTPALAFEPVTDDAPLAAALDGDEPGDDDRAAPERRQATLALDAGDLDLALRYLADYRVLVVAEPLEDDALAVVVEACAFGGALLVVAVEPNHELPDLPAEATVFEAPDADPDGLFGRTVGRFAADLDRGLDGAQALVRATSEAGWQSTPA